MSLIDPNKAKRDERERRRNAGFVLKQVWVHKADTEEFKRAVESLPNNDLYSPASRVRKPKMPGMS